MADQLVKKGPGKKRKGLYDYGTMGGKDGGRVTPRGIGRAKRGFGRAMTRKR